MQLRLKKISTSLSARNEFTLALLFLLALFVFKAAVLVFLYRHGYLEYDGDGFTRSVHAWEWLQKPRFEVDAWLPLQFWLNGTFMRFWPDLFWEPRAVNILCSLVTVVNLFFIGRWLFGRVYGYATAALVALFPWESWFGLSGMAESMTHMCLSLGVLWFVRWLRTERLLHLSFASLGLLFATMLRYETWFYSLVYFAIVLYVAYRRRIFTWKILPVLALTFGFAAIWMLASWQQLGKPWGFVSKTSEINANLEGRNREYDLLERLFFYPRTLFDLMPRLTIPAVLASLLLAWRPFLAGSPGASNPRNPVRPYLALVWGEFLLFILTTLPTNNIAPGSARYPVSNLLLLLPVVVWLFGYVAGLLPQIWMRGVVAAVFVVLAASFVLTTLDRPTDFPDGNVRQIALWFKDQTESGKLPANITIPAHLPNPLSPEGKDYGYIYALTVLTNRPDGTLFPGSTAHGVRVISELEGFQRTVQDDKPLAWIHINSAGDNDTIQALTGQYRTTLNFGPFMVVSGPLKRPLEVSPQQGSTGQEFKFTGEGFDPGEQVFLWVSWQGGVKNLNDVYADAQGRITVTYKPELPVVQSLTAKGAKSKRQGVAEIQVK